MITVLENSLTRKKHTLNLVDHKGRVVGFNPYPNGNPIQFRMTSDSHPFVETEKNRRIEDVLIGKPFHFGSDISFTPSDKDGELSAMNIEVVSDNLRTTEHIMLFGEGGEYYVEDLGLSKEDLGKLFSEDKLNFWKYTSYYNYYYSNLAKNFEKKWHGLDIVEKLDNLNVRLEKLERKVNLLGNAR